MRTATRKERPHRISAHIYIDLLVRKRNDALAIEHRHVDPQPMNDLRFDLLKRSAEQVRRIHSVDLRDHTLPLRLHNVVEGRPLGEQIGDSLPWHRTSTSTSEGTFAHRSSSAAQRRPALWPVRAAPRRCRQFNSDRNLHSRRISSCSSSATCATGIRLRASSSMKSARLTSAIAAPTDCEISPREYPSSDAATRTSRTNSSRDRRNGGRAFSKTSNVAIILADATGYRAGC